MIIVQQRRASVFGCVFAWGVFALFGQDILQDTHIWLTWCIFRWHVSFQDILKCKRGFATKRSSKSRRASNRTTIDGVEARDGLINVEEYRKKCQTVAKERQIRSNTKSLRSGKFFHLKRRARKTTFWCRFSSSLHLRAKSQRAQHIICNIQTTFLNPAHRLSSLAFIIFELLRTRLADECGLRRLQRAGWYDAGPIYKLTSCCQAPVAKVLLIIIIHIYFERMAR